MNFAEIDAFYLELLLPLKDKSMSNYEVQSLVRMHPNYCDSMRIAFKIWIDPFYSKVMNFTKSSEAVVNAGFFDDGVIDSYFVDPQSHLRNLLTPFQIAKDNIAKLPNPNCKKAIILTTGSFAPVHIGHIAMMENARKSVEFLGYNVIAGYMSPSHDSYVSQKDEGKAKMHALKRIQLLETAVQSKGWIQIDPWESLYNRVAINFTDVICYLEDYFRLHLQEEVVVFYTFGTDYLNFANTFAFGGHCVLVPRKGYQFDKLHEILITDETIKANLDIVISSPGIERSISSSRIRRGSTSMLPSEIQSMYLDTLRTQSSRYHTIALRDDSAHSLKVFKDFGIKGLLEAYEATFKPVLLEAVKESYGVNAIEILQIKIASQQAIIKLLSKSNTVVSLDAVCTAEYNIRLSRVYSLAGNQISRIRMDVETNDLEDVSFERLSTITVVDDDIVSGKTMDHVCSVLLPSGIVGEQISLFEYGHSNANFDDVYEILDERDFLFGAKDGGLKVGLPNNQLVRVPYILPFVNPTWRCQVNPDQALDFSRKIVLANIQFFSQFPAIRLRDCNPENSNFFYYLGFNPNSTMLEVVAHFWSILQHTP
jgi:nicotinic acid mononucleotide adenylyltransferase